MPDAPALPAQTPGMFVGGGGSGAALSGECAAAVADAGLSAADLGTVEAVTASVEAAAGRCQRHREARWLEEAERAFEPEAAGRSADESERARLRGRPTSRQRHLELCVAAPLLDPRFFRTDPTDPRTNTRAGRGGDPPGAAGYDPLRALSGPVYRGPTMTTAVLSVISKLDAPLTETPPGELPRRRPEGAALSADETTTALRNAICTVLRAAASEDAPRLRSVELAELRRPRQEESSQREAKRARPEAPTTAETAQPEANGVDPEPDADSGAPSSDTGHSAGGCVEAHASSSVAAMREELHAERSSADVEPSEAAEQEDLSARRTASRSTVDYEAAAAASRQSDGASVSAARAEAGRRRAAAALASAIAARAIAGARRAAGPASGEQALLLEQHGQVGSSDISGHVPVLASPPPRPQGARRVLIGDE